MNTPSQTVTGESKASREFRVNESFKRGDTLAITAHNQPKGKGLSYPEMVVVALEDGAIGGWDVYDGQLGDGSEVSFYGFSVV